MERPRINSVGIGSIVFKPLDPCSTCLGWNWSHQEYVPASGTGDSGILCVGEASGEHEALEGMPFVGKSGGALFQQLQRVGISRDGLCIHNVLSCRPPKNLLVKQPYEDEVIKHCSPLLDATIHEMQEKCRHNGKHFTIITLGVTAWKRIMGLTSRDPMMHESYINYVHWSEKYQAYVIAVEHPASILRGRHHMWPVVQFAFKRAIEVADNGITYDEPDYLLDPHPSTFSTWATDYLETLKDNPDDTFLSYDIETPYKQGKDEEKVAKEDNDDYSIIRCSFSYKPGEAISVPWRAEYLPILEELFGTNGIKLGWNLNYDHPRVAAQLPINGIEIDAMTAWHVLNSSLPKGLGFVTPFYAQSTSMWKHLSKEQPAFYNAKDAEMALINWLGIRNGLKGTGLWNIFDRHVIQLDHVLKYMTGVGVLRDEVMRNDAETKLTGLLDSVESNFDHVVPHEARRHSPPKGYVKVPKSTENLVQIEVKGKVKRCSICGLQSPLKSHFKPVSANKLKLGLDNMCEDAEVVITEELIKRWARPLDFKISKVGLTNYQSALKHQAFLSRREHKVTFDEIAIGRLIKKYPNDPLYPLILEHREYQKLLSTYIGVTDPLGNVRGGMPIGKDGRIHTLYTQNPETLRLASQHPNLQNLPRPKGKDDLATIIRNLIVAGPGQLFTARDYSGIEAVLVGYFALSPGYIRLAKIDVHSFYTAYALNQIDGRVRSNDLPLLSWEDEKLIPHLRGIKKEFGVERNSLYKHLVHGANFMQGVAGAREKVLKETGVEPPFAKVKMVMDIYFELFPEIRRWHRDVMNQAEKDGFLRNPFGYVTRFNRVFKYEKVGGKWNKSPGDESNAVIANLPQSTAAGIIKESMLRLYFQLFDSVGQYLRLQTHDELLAETPETLVDQVDSIMKLEMERPIPELPLPSRYKMGTLLSIDTEAKRGIRWGSMS